MPRNRTARKGFSLIELVIVVVIIAIIGAIAIPRMSRGAQGAADSALTGDLAQLRSAIEMYATEHSSTFPTLADISAQLTEYTDDSGTPNATKGGQYIYGPYLRAIPALPVGGDGFKGSITFVDGSSGSPGASAGGWFYNATTGTVQANTGATGSSVSDEAGTLYNTY